MMAFLDFQLFRFSEQVQSDGVYGGQAWSGHRRKRVLYTLRRIR